MELPLFEQVADLIRALTPEELGELHVRAHRRGVKVWFDQATVPKEHYEAQMLARRHIDGRDGMAIEVGFHSEHPKKPDNEAALARVLAHEANWRDTLGVEAVAGVFSGPTTGPACRKHGLSRTSTTRSWPSNSPAAPSTTSPASNRRVASASARRSESTLLAPVGHANGRWCNTRPVP